MSPQVAIKLREPLQEKFYLTESLSRRGLDSTGQQGCFRKILIVSDVIIFTAKLFLHGLQVHQVLLFEFYMFRACRRSREMSKTLSKRFKKKDRELLIILRVHL